MSFIVYGMTMNAAEKIADKKYLTGKNFRAGEEVFKSKKSVQLSYEFSAPQFAYEFIELIKKLGIKHKNLHIKVKERFIDDKTGKAGFRLKKYQENLIH